MTGNGNGAGNGPSLYRRLDSSLVEFPLNRQQKFLPLDVVEEAITEESVKAVFPRTFLALHRRVPSKIVKQAKKVFAILVVIGELHAIKDLLSEGITDDHLPLSRRGRYDNVLVSSDGKEFPSFSKWKTEARVTDFVDKQWFVLAPVVDSSGDYKELDTRCPLPFSKMDGVGGGHDSVVYKSVLHPAHQKGLKVHGKELLVATKEFRNEAVFSQERGNLDTCQKLEHDHLIRHHIAYKKDTQYYVIFPWADGGSLRNFWENEDTSPRSTELALWSLRQMVGLASALEALHSVNCRHGDLKPDNILHFKEGGKGRLSIADVGISRTHKTDTEFRHVGTTTRATTPSYEAPETFVNTNAPRGRRYDMWSLGCIFLEFTIWFLHDFEAINSFGHARHAPHFEFYLGSGGQADIHPVVSRAMDSLRQDIRCKGGTALGALVNLIDQKLLQIEVERRATAPQVVEKLQEIVRDAETTPSYLFTGVSDPPDKLRFPARTQTGIFEPIME